MPEFKSAAAGETEAQWRQSLSYLFKQDSTGLSTDGVLGGLAVSQTTTASTGVLIASGAAVVQDTLVNGVSQLVNNATKTLDVLTANPVGATPRNDIVVFDSTTTPVSIRSITGTPNAVPSDPTVPVTAVPLARLRHAASATTIPGANIDDIRVMTSLKGDSGQILGVYTGAFDPNLPPSGITPANKVWGNNPQDIAWCDIPDQGRPYRVMLNCYAEVGSELSGTRYDFGAYVAGSAALFGGFVSSDEVVRWRQLVSWPSAVVSGARRVSFRASRTYGTGYGMLTPYNQVLVVTVFAA